MATRCSNSARVGLGSLPLKPPMVMTGLPEAMMIEAVVWDPVPATRYLAVPWWASR